MSKKRSQRNTKKYLKSLKAKRQKFYYGGYGGAPASSAPINYGENRGGQFGGVGEGEYSSLPTTTIGIGAESVTTINRPADNNNVDYGDGGYYTGMGTGTGGYNPLGTTYGTPGGGTSSSSGSGSAGDGSGMGARNRAPAPEPKPEKTPKELHDELVEMGFAEGEYEGGEADATNDGTLENDGEGGGGGGDGGDEQAAPPIKPIVEEEKETTTGGTDLTGTDLDVDIAEPKTKFVNEDGSTFNPEAAPVDTNPFDKVYTSRGGATYSKDDLMRLTGGDKDKLQELEESGYFNTIDGESWKAPVDSTDVYNDDGTLNLSNMDADLGLDGQDGPDLGGDLSAGDEIVNAGDEGLSWQGKVWDAAKGVFVKTVVGAAVGAAIGDYYGFSKTMLAKLMGKEAFKGAVIDEATGAILDIATGLPIVGAPLQAILDFRDGVKDIPADIWNSISAPSTTMLDTSGWTTNTNIGYDSAGNIQLGGGTAWAGTVSNGAGTASSDNPIVTGGTVTADTNPITVPDPEPEDLEVTEDEEEDSNTDSTTYDNSDLGQVLEGLNLGGTNGDDGMALNEITDDVTDLADTAAPIDALDTVAKTDKTLVTAEDDIKELGTMTQATAPTVGATNLEAVDAAQAATTTQAAPVVAQTVNTVSADQVKQQKASEAFNLTPEAAAFKEASDAHMANPERAALAQAYQTAGASGDEGALAKAQADLKAFDSDFIAQAQTFQGKQREFMSTYGDAKAVTGEISEGSTAVSTDATMSTEATVADRNTAAEQAALAQNVGFDVSTKSTVDPVTGEKIIVAATPAAEAAQRDAITDDTFTPMEAAQITAVLGYDITKTRPVKGEAAVGAASEMLAEVGDLPPAITAAIVEDPEKVEAQLDNQPVEVRAAIAALPKEALMSSQMENLLGSLEENKVPAWARPAVDATNAMLAKRGLSSSTIGRDSLFNAIIQSALPIAENNANALQKRAAQNLDNEQQANITTATLDMNRRLANLANQQTAVSQTAQMANEMKKLQSSFTQEAVISTAAQEQQVRVQNLENRQRTAEQNNRNRQETMALNLGNEQQMTLANLEFEAASDRDNMTADNQRKLAEMNVAAEFLSKNAELKNSMDIANMSTESQMKLANLKAQNQASSDNLTATQQTELANLEATLKTNLTQADIASNMGVAQLNADQQRAVVNAQTNANIDLAKFDAASQVELVNSKFAQTMTMNEFDAKNTAILQNATNQASMDLSNADNRTKVSVQNASNFLQMDLSNMSNEQQVEILGSQQEQQILLADTAAANATAQFNAESVAQTDQFMATLGAQIDQYNATAISSMAKFNVEQENKINAENAGNQLQASIANATLASDTEQFNLNMANQREQWNASNAQTIQQGDLTWRRNANTADTAAINDANRQNVANAFAMSQQKQAQVWRELQDETMFANNNYENNQNRIIQIATATMAADTSYAAIGVTPAMSLVQTLDAVGLGDDEESNNN